MPDPLALFTRLIATHLKKPTLSRTIDITMVDKIVIEAPLTMLKISNKLEKGTMPNSKKREAPIAAGIVSFTFQGFHSIISIVKRKIETVKNRLKSYIRPRLIV
jgi:hypothetical protein